MTKNTAMTLDIVRMHIRNNNVPSAQRVFNSMLRILDGKERDEFASAAKQDISEAVAKARAEFFAR